MLKVMFVCLGNICRSPMAEAILVHKAREKGLNLRTQSSGTAAYHIGESPDHRTMQVLEANGIVFEHKAQQFRHSHFEEFDYVLVMDENNQRDVQRLGNPKVNSKVYLMRSFDQIGDDLTVADPWYGDIRDFEECFDTLDRSIDGFIHFLVEKHESLKY